MPPLSRNGPIAKKFTKVPLTAPVPIARDDVTLRGTPREYSLKGNEGGHHQRVSKGEVHLSKGREDEAEAESEQRVDDAQGEPAARTAAS